MSEPEMHFFPGNNAIAVVSGKPTKRDMEDVIEAIEKHDRENQPRTYTNDRTGKQHKRKYKLTDEQNAKIMDALNALLAITEEYEVPVYAAVQTSYDPFKKGTPGTVSGIHMTIPPRASVAFDLAQSVSNLICNYSLTSSEFDKLYQCVDEIIKGRKKTGSKKGTQSSETAL